MRSLLFFQESGLMLVILVLGALIALKCGTVNQAVFVTNADGTRQRAVTASGDPATVEVNKFLNAESLAQLAKDMSFIGIMAVGMAVVIISGGIDLSVGSIWAVSAVLAALVMHKYGPTAAAPMNPWEATLLGAATCLGVGTMCGLINGVLVVALRVHPFIITLGTMVILRGAAFVASGGLSIGDFPQPLRDIIRHETGTDLYLVPPSVMLVVMVAGTIFLSRLAAGRRVYAVGGNELASRFSGIRVAKVKVGVYVISGLSAGIAALLSLGYYGAASSGDAQGYELDVIAAAVVGGCSLLGGRGTALGAVLGALVIQMITNGIIILGIDQNYSRIIIGTVIVVAVVLDNFSTWVNRRRMARRAH